MMMNSMPPHNFRQRGVSLVVTLMIVILLSLLALYGAGVLVLDTRTAANDFRAREAMAAAESGVEQGFSLLNANRALIKTIGLDLTGDGDLLDANESAWTVCTSTAAPCLSIRTADRTNWQYLTINAALTSQPAAGSFSVFLLSPVPDPDPEINNGSRLVYNIVTTGLSADGTSTASVKQGVYLYPLLLGNIAAPVASAGNIPLGGAYSIVTNHPASGQALTAWSKDAITTSGSTDRCFAGEFVSNGGSSCPSGSDLDAQTGPGACDDDLCQDANFPSDLFKFLFGVPKAEYQKIKDQARVVADCSGLNASSSGLIWVTGSCNPSGTVGSVDAPVLLIVQGETSLNGGAKIFGFLNMFNPDSTATPKLTSNGNASIEGAVFSHRASCPETGSDKCLQLNGGFVLKYNVTVLNNIRNNPSGRALARISGAWSDMQ